MLYSGTFLIADIGCGTGGQTMVLAKQTPGQITGIDLFPTFVDLFNRNAAMLNLEERVKGEVGSMDNLPFRMEELDLIWSEGAIYIPVGVFILPENCWLEHFYEPQVMAQEAFLKKYSGNQTVEAFIATERRESQLYYRYKEYYGYVFFIGKKL